MPRTSTFSEAESQTFYQFKHNLINLNTSASHDLNISSIECHFYAIIVVPFQRLARLMARTSGLQVEFQIINISLTVSLKAMLGIVTLLFYVPVPLGVLHQASQIIFSQLSDSLVSYLHPSRA